MTPDPTGPNPDDDPMEDLAATPAAAEVLALASAAAPRAALRGQVLAAALAARASGRPAGIVPGTTAPECLGRTLDEMGRFVDSLTEEEAAAPTIEGWTIAGLLGHLGAIEEHFGAVLGWWPEPGPIELEHDHLAMTVPAALAAQAAPFEEVRRRWHEVVARVTGRLASLESRSTERVAFHGFDFSIRSLLIARTFEVWTHSEDIAKAIGRPAPVLDIARLRLMTDTAVKALPLGMLLTGREPRGRSVRVVLTGDGGGTWVQALDLGAEAGEPEATLVAGALDFCRVAARRATAADLEWTVVGDRDLADDVLVAAAVFAA